MHFLISLLATLFLLTMVRECAGNHCYNNGTFIASNFSTGERARCNCSDPRKDVYGPRCEVFSISMNINASAQMVPLTTTYNSSSEIYLTFEVLLIDVQRRNLTLLCWDIVGESSNCTFMKFTGDFLQFGHNKMIFNIVDDISSFNKWYEYRINISQKDITITVDKDRFKTELRNDEKTEILRADKQIILHPNESICYRELRINNELQNFPFTTEGKCFPSTSNTCSTSKTECKNGQCYNYEIMNKSKRRYCLCENEDVLVENKSPLENRCKKEDEDIISLIGSNGQVSGSYTVELHGYKYIPSKVKTEKIDLQFRSTQTEGVLLDHENKNFTTTIRLESGCLNIPGLSHSSDFNKTRVSDSLWHLLELEFFRNKETYWLEVTLDEEEKKLYSLNEYDFNYKSQKGTIFLGGKNMSGSERLNNTCFKNVRANGVRVKFPEYNATSRNDSSLCTQIVCENCTEYETCQGEWPFKHCVAEPTTFPPKPKPKLATILILSLCLGGLVALLVLFCLLLVFCCGIFKDRKSKECDDIMKVTENKMEYNSSDAKEEDYLGKIDFDLLKYHCGILPDGYEIPWSSGNLARVPPPSYHPFDPTLISGQLGVHPITEDTLEYGYEGARDSVSTMRTSVADSSAEANYPQDFNYLNNWGPKFRNLSHLYIPE